MLDQIKNSLLIAASNSNFKVIVQVLPLVLVLIAVFLPSGDALAGASWGGEIG